MTGSLDFSQPSRLTDSAGGSTASILDGIFAEYEVPVSKRKDISTVIESDHFGFVDYRVDIGGSF